MLSVSDILKILEKVPVWKVLKELPKRVEELEARVAELEEKGVAPETPKWDLCPKCREYDFRLDKAERHRYLTGIEFHHMRCHTCGYEGIVDV